MAIGAVQQISIAGIAQTYTAPASSDTVAVDNDDTFLHIKNGNGSALTVTITDPGHTPSGSAATNPTVTVAATTGDKMVALPRSLADPITGLVAVGFSVTSSVLVAALKR